MRIGPRIGLTIGFGSDEPIFRDGPNNSMYPKNLAQWQQVGGGWSVPDFQLQGQEAASPLVEDVQGASMIAAGAPLFRQTLAGWTSKWLRTAETATEGFYATAGQLWNPNVQSVFWVGHFRLTALPAALRVLAMLGGANGYLSINGSGVLQLRNSGIATGTYNYFDGTEHWWALEYILGAGVLGHVGAGTWRVSTRVEQLTGTWEVLPDDVKGYGGCGAFTPPPCYYGRQEAWIGSKAEALTAVGVKPLMLYRGLPVTGY